MGAEARQITFTSGATEANNTAVFSHWERVKSVLPAGMKPIILTTRLEHASVAKAVDRLSAQGAETVYLPVSGDGLADAQAFAEAMSPEVVLVTLPWVNNVFGTRQPVGQVGDIIVRERANRKDKGLPLAFLCDAVQAARFEVLRPSELGIDFLSLSAHKIYGPKGVGCLWSRKTVEHPLVVGGGQEAGRRSGTENVSGIVGFGTAARIMGESRSLDLSGCVGVNDRLRDFAGDVRGLEPVGSADSRVPGIVFLKSRQMQGDDLALRLDVAGVAVATGSACDSGNKKASNLLTEVLGTGAASRGGIRLSWGRFTGKEDVDRLREAMSRLLQS